ncbi:class I SAM-dependent methyltransferase [Micromonospora sp. CPCC 205371]|nr:class I SAM-dependent methyltransferase [Micromonospora sp. CPCC 205371]
MTAGFDPAYAGRGAARWLVDSGGRRVRLPLRRWHGPAEPAVRALVDLCTGPAVDVGCGPGRVAAELAARGLISFGIDTSPAAVRLTRRRGAAALRRDVFDPLPGEGRWTNILLVDGNIGIGGDPSALLRRCAQLLRRGGTVLAELDAPGTGVWRGLAHVTHERMTAPPARGAPFRWARVGADAVHGLAAGAGLRVRAVFTLDGRWFAELEKP